MGVPFAANGLHNALLQAGVWAGSPLFFGVILFLMAAYVAYKRFNALRSSIKKDVARKLRQRKAWSKWDPTRTLIQNMSVLF